MTATDNERRMKLYHLGWEDHKRGEIRPSHYPERAEGWDARDEAVHVRRVEVIHLNRPTRTDDNAAYRRDMIDAGRGHLLRG